MYPSSLLPLPRLINHILTYSLYPMKNHTELTYETAQIIVNKIPIQCGIFIVKQMLTYQSDPPYGSLICKYLDSVLHQKLSELSYLPCRMGYTIKASSINKMGLLINPTRTPEAVSSHPPPQTPHTSSSSTSSLTPGDYRKLCTSMTNLTTRFDRMEKSCVEMKSELINLTRFQYHSSYAMHQDMNAMMKWANLKRRGYDWPYPGNNYLGYKDWFEKSGYPKLSAPKECTGDPYDLSELGLGSPVNAAALGKPDLQMPPNEL